MREALVPGAPTTAALPRHKALPLLQKIKMIGEGLDVLDINLDPMEDIEGREEQVSERDGFSVTPQPDNVSNVSLELGDTSASGYKEIPQQQVKTAHSSRKSQHRSRSDKD